MSRWADHLRSRLLAGLVFLLPAVITVWMITLLFRAADDAVTVQVLRLVQSERPAPPAVVWASRGVALLTVLLVLYAVGALATNMLGRRMLASGERAVARVPVVGGVYGGFRQLLDAFGPTGGGVFRRSVLIEYPPGVWRVAFVTNDRAQTIGDPPRPHVAVFVPMTPNPTSGDLVFVPPESLHPLALSSEEGLKMIVSGGIVMPDRPLAAGAAGPAEDAR